MSRFSTIEEILTDFSQGRFVILVDDENRENEGDLLISAEFIEDHHVNFMAQYARGLICLAMPPEQVEKLKLPMMKSFNHQSSKLDTAFTMSIEARTGVSTGISCADRTQTIRVASHQEATPEDLVIPGHIFPLKAHPQGVLGRAGHTEAGVDLAKLTFLQNTSTVICEIMKEDGEMARVEDLIRFSIKHQIKIGTIENLIKYRKLQNEEKNI